MCKVIAIANQKGGVGKTTTAISLGISLSRLKQKVLLIDLDGQANLTMSLGYEPDELNNTITNLIENRINDYNYKIDTEKYFIETEGIYLLPSDIGLSSIEVKMLNTLNRENILKNIIKDFKDMFDFILIDCLPLLGNLTINALAASDSVIIPVQSQYLSMRGMEQLMQTIIGIKAQINPNLEIEGILLTMYDKRTNLSKEVFDEIYETYGDYINVFENAITISTKIAEAPSQGVSIFTYNPNSEVAKSYELLAREVLNNE
ncbi:chromosome partitioning protein [Sedimentibacter acidaminivorans]|uniref:Chromosome partitioning protein n=1 Tax=Sedimentibacter acidaminivorans TaxID=913099 RepID=A0ABS4GGC4_9FIRM|nr:ParA family protein [Sedimentibacter acidaminivorans]MBP1926750.1 chromosome partitioning protein [Sedimentibacter acidaminivorans]